MEWGPDEIKRTQMVFQEAMKCVISDDTLRCPPVLYVGFSSHCPGSKLLEDILAAPVHSSTGLQLEIRDGVCAKCSVTISYAFVGDNDVGEKFCVTNEKGETVPYEQSKCHPAFRDYSRARKFFGGMAHLLTALLRCCIEWPILTVLGLPIPQIFASSASD